MSPEAERELLDYLRASQKHDVGKTLQRIADWTIEHSKEDAVRHEEIRGTLRGHSLRIGALEKNDDKIDTRFEQSGSWQLEAEKAKVIAEKSATLWWKEKAITIIVGLVMLLLGGSASLFFKR